MIALQTGACLGTKQDGFQDQQLRIQRTLYLPNQPTDAMHCHQHVHLSLVLSGANLERKKASHAERGPGCLTFYYAGEAHQTIHKRFPAQHLKLEVDNAWFDYYQWPQEHLCKGVQTNPHAALTLIKLYHECQLNDGFSASSMSMLLQGLLPLRAITGVRPPWVTMVYEYLQDAWQEPIHLPDLARASGVHPVTISKYFPHYFRDTLGQYLRKLRVAKALPLIKASRLSLTQIAYQCGFADQSHMTRCFQQLTGFDPKRFQQL